jgi:prolyl 4-hydroxylase
MAVIWNNLYPDGTPNPDTLHQGMPVKAGHKAIITKWFRKPPSP